MNYPEFPLHPEPRSFAWTKLEIACIENYAKACVDADRAQRAAPVGGAQPVAWAGTDEDGNVVCLGMNQSRRFDTPLYAAAQPVEVQRVPDDPMDWPLPCDVTVGHGTMHKGVSLRTLVMRMKTLYKMATGNDADEVAARKPNEQQVEAFREMLRSIKPAGEKGGKS